MGMTNFRVHEDDETDRHSTYPLKTLSHPESKFFDRITGFWLRIGHRSLMAASAQFRHMSLTAASETVRHKVLLFPDRIRCVKDPIFTARGSVVSTLKRSAGAKAGWATGAESVGGPDSAKEKFEVGANRYEQSAEARGCMPIDECMPPVSPQRHPAEEKSCSDACTEAGGTLPAGGDSRTCMIGFRVRYGCPIRHMDPGKPSAKESISQRRRPGPKGGGVFLDPKG
jgi:hypothetical protein